MNRSTLARKIRLFVVATLLGAMINVVAPLPVVYASTFKVDTATDDPTLDGCEYLVLGDCSLRGAINKANNTPGLDTITFTSSLNGTPIILTIPPDGTPDDNQDGDLDILGVGGDLIIQGRGAANTIIDGGEIDRVFHVCPDGGCDNTVTFEGVTIQRGDSGLADGGGIYNVGSTTTVDSSTVISNTATNSGAGLCNLTTLTIQNGSIVSNNMTRYGGGIYNPSGTTTVDDSTVSSNMAEYNGGGVYNLSTLIIQNGSTFGGNTAADAGGGIYSNDTLIIQSGSTVGGNTATDGGGIYNTGALTVANSTIGGASAVNLATDEGGGIFNSNGGTALVVGSTVSRNGSTSILRGGGVHSKGITTIGGGGIYNKGVMTLDGSAISDNMAVYGGGIYHDGGVTTVTGSCIVGNSDTSFFNNQTVQQTATGNWWGAASGPSGVGPGTGDSVSANVDYGGFLTTCPSFCSYYIYLPLVVKK